MNILILGSEGFIGRNCVQFFLQKGYAVFGADLFERETQPYTYFKISRLSPELEELFSRQPFDVVINAAGSGNVPYSMTHPLIDFEANCLDCIRVLETIRRYRPGCRYIHLSSAAVYGNPERIPVREADRTLPLSPYGHHKLMSEQICREYVQLFGLSIAIARPFSVYGPGLKKQLFWDTFQKLNTATETITLFGTGKESRDFIYISDLVQALECILLNSPMQGQVYNLASGEETRIDTAVAVYHRALALPNAVGFAFNGTVRSGDPLNWKADISAIRAIGYQPAVDLDTGLAATAHWIKTIPG